MWRHSEGIGGRSEYSLTAASFASNPLPCVSHSRLGTDWYHATNWFWPAWYLTFGPCSSPKWPRPNRTWLRSEISMRMPSRTWCALRTPRDWRWRWITCSRCCTRRVSCRWSWSPGPAVNTWKHTSTPPTVWPSAPSQRVTTGWTWWTWPTATPVSISAKWWSARISSASLRRTSRHCWPPATWTFSLRRRCTAPPSNGSKPIWNTTTSGWIRSCLRLARKVCWGSFLQLCVQSGFPAGRMQLLVSGELVRSCSKDD